MSENKLIEAYERGFRMGYELGLHDLYDAYASLNLSKEKRLTEFLSRNNK